MAGRNHSWHMAATGILVDASTAQPLSRVYAWARKEFLVGRIPLEGPITRFRVALGFSFLMAFR